MSTQIIHRQIFRFARTIGVAVTIFLFFTEFVNAQQNQQGLSQLPRFDSAESRQESTTAFRFVINNWIIDGGQIIEEFPEQGFMIMQLRGGELTTVINGERVERDEDEFWTVPTDAVLVLETGDDSASLQTVLIIRN